MKIASVLYPGFTALDLVGPAAAARLRRARRALSARRRTQRGPAAEPTHPR